MKHESSRDPYEAIDALAAGEIRGPEVQAERLLVIAWPVLQRRVIRQGHAVGLHADRVRSDVAQDVAHDVWRSRHMYRGHSTREFNGWFKRISWSRVCKTLRGDRNQGREQPIGGFEPAGSEGVGLEPMLENEKMEAIRRCLDRLRADDEQAADVVSLRFFADVTFQIISEVIGRPLGTVKEQYGRGIRHLGRCLERSL